MSTSQNALVANQAKCSWWQKSPCLAANIPKASFARPTIKPPPLKTVYTLFVRYCFLKVLGELCADLMESAVFPATAILEQPFDRINMTLLPNLHCSSLKLSVNPEPQKKSTCLTIPSFSISDCFLSSKVNCILIISPTDGTDKLVVLNPIPCAERLSICISPLSFL